MEGVLCPPEPALQPEFQLPEFERDKEQGGQRGQRDPLEETSKAESPKTLGDYGLFLLLRVGRFLGFLKS